VYAALVATNNDIPTAARSGKVERIQPKPQRLPINPPQCPARFHGIQCESFKDHAMRGHEHTVWDSTTREFRWRVTWYDEADGVVVLGNGRRK
jgi:hypothetical protein